MMAQRAKTRSHIMRSGKTSHEGCLEQQRRTQNTIEELFYYNNSGSGILNRDYILQNVKEESISKRNRFSRPNHLDQNSSVISISVSFDFVKEF